MAGNISAAAQQRIAALGDLLLKVQRVHGLVEQFAAARTGQDSMAIPIKRAFAQLKREFMGAGLDAISQLAGSMELAAGRGMGPQAKARILREGVGSIRFQIELEQRAVLAEAKAEAAEES
jgi:hypothetical protein